MHRAKTTAAVALLFAEIVARFDNNRDSHNSL
jgi:hypothetical protein